MKNKNTVSIHIRRGDYENDPEAKFVLGGICTLDYYKKSIEYLNERIEQPYYCLFSNNPEWTQENFAFLKNSLIIDWNLNKESWQDMMLMSMCRHNVIANSSFSWWGAWLNRNPDKIVIAPSKWFNIYEAADIVPDQWVRI